jgi:hypothetical protein
MVNPEPDLWVKNTVPQPLNSTNPSTLITVSVFSLNVQLYTLLGFLGHCGTHSAEHRQTGRDNEGKYFVFLCTEVFLFVLCSFLLISDKFRDLILMHWPLFRAAYCRDVGRGGVQ